MLDLTGALLSPERNSLLRDHAGIQGSFRSA